ncbi:MAG: glycosyltransferase [Flavobacteriaceae bacterium]|jgi:glycosyltransferase involved in cell wall biosynthesis|nr:glycosyltransferase [Flavobacteriaceae bacterium]
MKILISVFNNLYTDQRIEKICKTLYNNGFKVELIGNSWDGLPEIFRPYPFTRIKLKSKNLKFAYPEFNQKLYSLLMKKADKNTILVSNDLDTLFANFYVSKNMNIPLIFDSHEIFTEMPSVRGRFTQKIWRFLERSFIPKLKYMMTASESYALWFSEKYKIPLPVVIQNFSRKIEHFDRLSVTKNQENLTKIILYQGTINPSRGLDKIIPAMKNFDDAELWIAGNGPKFEEYSALSKALNLENKVKFLGKILPEKLREITQKADVGLSIEENNGESYFYSLPNKISDYIQARVPIVVSDFPEMKKIVERFHVGEIIENHSEEELVKKISIVLRNGKKYYRSQLETAASELCWENEEPKLLELYKKVVLENF